MKLVTVIKMSAITTFALMVGGCGSIAEKVTEEGVERIIEAESGENVELDFDSGDGSFSIETEEGGFSFDEDGNFVVTDQDGSVFSGSADNDGLVVYDEDGDPVLNVDGDAEGGELTVLGDDGESVYRVDTSIPAEWPNEILRPEGLDVEAGIFAQGNGDTVITVVGEPSGSAADFAATYGDSIAAAGFDESSRFDSAADGGSTVQRSYENDNWQLNVTGFIDDSTNVVNILLASKTN